MKTLVTQQKSLIEEGRWDFDYHSPAELIKRFPPGIVRKVIEAAEIVKEKKDPTKEPEKQFEYIDISCIDVKVGEITRTQELTGEEAPSRARKLVRGYHIIVSTCRPTRKAIAVVPETLHGQICSTGFSVIKARNGVNPYFLHFALRLDSTIEQFRKFSTGSSYPAILDNDVEKTLIPLPELEIQNSIVRRIRHALHKRNSIIRAANDEWESKSRQTVEELSIGKYEFADNKNEQESIVWDYENIIERINSLSPITDVEVNDNNELGLAFEEFDDNSN